MTDAGLANLVGLPLGDWLGLGETCLTDDAVVHLVKLQNLQSLNITGTKISEEGVAKLRQALPNLKDLCSEYEE